MQRNLIFFSVILIFNLSFLALRTLGLNEKPDEILDLEYDQKKANEKYITAQILSQSLNQVYRLFEENLAVGKNHELNQEASISFLKMLTDLINKLEIKVLQLKPLQKEVKDNITIIPYKLELQCDYEKFGKLILELEKHDRILKIEEFILDNGLQRISKSLANEALMEQNIEITISTITLNKSAIIK